MIKPLDSDQLARLPKYAREHIEVLTMRLIEAHNKIEQQRDGTRGPFFVEDMEARSDSRFRVGDRISAQFGDDRTDRITVTAHGESLYFDIVGDRELVITPRASNRIEIRCPERPLSG